MNRFLCKPRPNSAFKVAQPLPRLGGPAFGDLETAVSGSCHAAAPQPGVRQGNPLAVLPLFSQRASALVERAEMQ